MEIRAEHGLAGLLAAGLALGAMQAHAEDKTGFYVGLGVGNASVQDRVGNGELGHVNFNGDDTSFKVLAGYMFIPWLGLELAYHDFGSPNDTLKNIGAKAEVEDATAWSGELIAQLPLGPVDIFAKGGIVSYDAKIKVRGEEGNFQDSPDGEEAILGAGAQFNIGPFAIRGEYEYLDIVDGVDLFTLSAIWHI